MKPPTIKGLYEKLGVDEEEIKKLRETIAKDALFKLFVIYVIRQRGGVIHNVNVRATAKRRAANKAARKQRRVNRVRHN